MDRGTGEARRVIELVEGEHGWTVIVGGNFADGLGPDEALWVVATLLAGGDRPRWLKSYAAWHAWREQYSRVDPLVRPVAALPDLRAQPSPYVATRRARVCRTFDADGFVLNRYVLPC